MEIMGLAIIIILIVFGLMFYFRFTMGKKQTQYHLEYSLPQLAVNVANTLLDTSTKCRKQSFRGLYGSCADDTVYTEECGGSLDKVCTYAHEQTEKILQDTLGSIGIQYYFVVTRTPQDPSDGAIPNDGSTNFEFCDSTSCEPCGGEKVSSSPIPITTSKSDIIYAILDICK